MISKNFRGTIFCLLAALIWGSAFVAQSVGTELVGPFSFVAARNWLAVLLLLPLSVIAVRRNPAEQKKTEGKDKRTLVLWSVISGAVLFAAQCLQQTGIKYTSVGKSGFITALYVVFVPIVSVLLGVKPKKVIWLCAILAVCGLWLLCGVGAEDGLNKGDLLTFLCALAFTGDIMVLDKISTNYNCIVLSCMRCVVCALLGTAIALPAEAPSFAVLAAAFWPIAYAGFMSSGVAYTLQVAAQQDTDPTAMGVIFCLESVFSALSGWVVLHEVLTGTQLIGCAIMFGAIVLCSVSGAQKQE